MWYFFNWHRTSCVVSITTVATYTRIAISGLTSNNVLLLLLLFLFYFFLTYHHTFFSIWYRPIFHFSQDGGMEGWVKRLCKIQMGLSPTGRWIRCQFSVAAGDTKGVTDVSSSVKNSPAGSATGAPYAFFLLWETSHCEIYGCGGHLLMASRNAPYLFEIYCCYFMYTAYARPQLTRDLLVIAKFLVVLSPWKQATYFTYLHWRHPPFRR